MRKQEIVLIIIIFIIASLFVFIYYKLGGFRVIYTEEQKKKMVVEYMEKKYGQEFELVHCWWENLMISRSGDEYLVKTKNKEPEDQIRVQGSYEENGDYTFWDGYFGILIADRYTEYVNNLVGEIYDEFYLQVNTDTETKVFSDRFRADMPIDEIYKPDDVYYAPDKYVVIPYSQLKGESIAQSAYKIASVFLKHNLVGGIYLYVTKDEEYPNFLATTEDFYPGYANSYKDEKIGKRMFVKEGKMEYDYYCIAIVGNEENTGLKMYIELANE